MAVTMKEFTPRELEPVRTRRFTPLRLALATCLGLVVAFVAAYAAFFTPDSPPALSLSSAGNSDAAPGVGAPEGVWSVGPGSVAGYRVREKLLRLPAPNDAVGRTSAVDWELSAGGRRRPGHRRIGDAHRGGPHHAEE